MEVQELKIWLKNNEILSFTGKRVELENIILSEASQAKSHVLFLICGL
jgi:hypothetical protein